MLDLITLISTMGVQQELQDRKEVAISQEEGEETTLVEQAADSLASAFESFEDAVGSMFSASAEEPPPVNTRKMA